jgi:DNA polymerase-3 subunit delta
MLYILHGPDDFTRNEKIADLRSTIDDSSLRDLNVTLLEGRDLTLSDIRHHADTMPFMTAKRLVIVKGYLGQVKNKPDEIDQLIEYLNHLSPTTDLVLVEHESLNRRQKVLEAAAAIQAEIIHFAGLNKNNLRSWIIKKTREHKATIEPGAAELLGRLVGTDLHTLNNELEKLALYVAGRRPIQKADIELLVPYTEEAENFGLTNAIGQRNARKAYDQLHKLLDEGKHPMAILGTIAAQIRGLLEVKDMAERGLPPPEIAKIKGWNSDYPARMRLKEGAKFSMVRLEEILEQLLQIDLDIKTGQVDSMLALDVLVARLHEVR